jgi:hypothetical protein
MSPHLNRLHGPNDYVVIGPLRTSDAPRADLLPWADPYIASLWERARRLAAEGDGAQRGDRSFRVADPRVAPAAAEAPPPLDVTPPRSDQRPGLGRGHRPR